MAAQAASIAAVIDISETKGDSMANYKVIDADGHVRESNAGMREFLEPRWRSRPGDEN